ncbi:MAG: hypothetical protein O2868_06875 [Proteobacteria bacterium]|nr:hypothetical protein [Pseudomonadota bacterium]
MNRHLLLDERLIEAVENAELTLGTVTKHHANPLFGEDKPWERRFDNLYANIIYDEQDQLYKCWYSPFIVSQTTVGMTMQQRKERTYGKHPQEMGICYATSKDGIEWDKPELGLVDYDGSKANNIIWRGGGVHKDWGGPHGAGIFKDLRDPDPERRYKAILKDKILSVAFSADGIHWNPAIECPDANSAGDTHNNAFWAPTLGKYVGITRQWRQADDEYVRLVARTESDDFITWAKTENVLEGHDSNQQLYSMPVFNHGGIYLGLVAVHDQKQDRVWTELTWSPDTKTWHRVLPGTPLIGNDGDYGHYDWGCAYAAANPVFLDDEIRLYYGASDGFHFKWRLGFLAMATLRPDGFAGYKASSTVEPARVTISPPLDGASSLKISADIDVGGSLTVRLLDTRMQMIDESEALTASVTDAEVQWKDAGTLNKVKAARLQFVFSGATVCSLVLT